MNRTYAGHTRRQLFRRVSAIAITLALPLAACSDSGPDQADALDQITQHLRQGYPTGEKRIDKVTFVSGKLAPDGRYEMLVDYDLVTVMTSLDLFNTVNKPGTTDHIEGERFIFAKSDHGWMLVN